MFDAINNLRTTRWLDRCLSIHERPNEQSIFPIVQGGLNPILRSKSAHELIKRDVNGYAIGGLRYIPINNVLKLLTDSIKNLYNK